MSINSIILCGNFVCFRKTSRPCRNYHSRSVPKMHPITFEGRRYVILRLVPNASRKKKAWWDKFFMDNDDEMWSNWSAEDVLEDDNDGDVDKFESWKRKAEAISELREAQEDVRNANGREWEDWLLGDDPSIDTTTASSWEQEQAEPSSSVSDDKGLVGSLRKLITRYDGGGSSGGSGGGDDGDDGEDELLFEDRVFRYASTSSAKFIALLILIPWVLDFLVHDYVLMPFLDRYVKLVPLAAEMLDVRRHQKLEMVKTLRVERGRFQLEAEIGKSPPLSDEEVWLELRHKAIELRDEWRLENRRAFANIWSDMVYGISLFILIYSNKSK